MSYVLLSKILNTTSFRSDYEYLFGKASRIETRATSGTGLEFGDLS